MIPRRPFLDPLGKGAVPTAAKVQTAAAENFPLCSTVGLTPTPRCRRSMGRGNDGGPNRYVRHVLARLRRPARAGGEAIGLLTLGSGRLATGHARSMIYAYPDVPPSRTACADL